MATFQAVQEAIKLKIPVAIAQENLSYKTYQLNCEAKKKQEVERVFSSLGIEVLC